MDRQCFSLLTSVHSLSELKGDIVKAAHYRGQDVVFYSGYIAPNAIVQPRLQIGGLDLAGIGQLRFLPSHYIDDLDASHRFANGQESGHIVPPCDSLPKPRPSIGAVSSSGVALFRDGSAFSRSPMGVMSSYAYPTP